MHIDCLWVSGQYKGQGWAGQLLDRCLENSKQRGCVGVTALSSAKKRPFLSDGAFLRHRGFLLADTAQPYFELLYLPFAEGAPTPRFASCTKLNVADWAGLTILYSDQCPYADKYAHLAREAAGRLGVTIRLIKVDSLKAARHAPSPFATYSLFFNGKFVTNEILTEKKVEKLIQEFGLVKMESKT